jgi:chromosome segregation ATPase
VRAGIVASVLLVAAIGSIPQSASAKPDPSIDSVRARVDRLYQQAEQASERYNDIVVELKKSRSQLGDLRADVATQQRKVDDLADQVGDMVAAQAQSSPVGLTSQLLNTSTDTFLSGLAAMQAYGAKQADLLASYDDQSAELKLRQQELADQVDAIANAKQQLGWTPKVDLKTAIRRTLDYHLAHKEYQLE